MSPSEKLKITVQTTISKPADIVWELWTKPEHIIHWNFASDDWHCPRAENDLQPDGRFMWRMEAKDGSMGFDFSGTYEEILSKRLIRYRMDDDRIATIHFEEDDDSTRIIEIFEAEGMNPIELQKAGWQSILNNFRKYVESLA
ncbi:MAG: SRPBCC family protein [Saprospiraceae bacterium]|nr:SRPBCC family protein [Saprospiraceae bacterium]